ncbi:MAG: hypothetical protein IJ237_10390 [Oscillospiraceae bacterium]|nr:hypothetical protein [Oscillospiraceae bacterium]
MAEKNNKKIDLYTLPTALYTKDSPVLIYSGVLVMDRFSEKVSVNLHLRNIDEREVIAATVYIQPYSPWGDPYPQEVIYRYNSLKVLHDQEFGSRKLIPMPDNNVRSFMVFVSEVTFGDYSTWKNEKGFEPVGRAKPLEEALGSEEAARMFTARYGRDGAYMPLLEKDIWYCTCGAINRADKEKCYNCRRNKDAFQTVNYETLKSDAKKRADAEKKEDEQIHKEKKEKGRVFLKVAMIVLPLLLAAALIFSTVPPFLARREAYANAQTALEEGKYDEARQLFEDLGDYLDSRNYAENEILYRKAMAVYKGAQKSDASVLPLAGLSRSDISDSDDLGMVLYGKAKELLEPLGDYRDAKETIRSIDAAFQAFEDQKILDRYHAAVKLLEDGEYLGARDAFLALGDYRDSADMATEALYRRASAALAFVESNKTRGIYLLPSSDKEVKSIVSMPGSVLTALGSDHVYQLKQCFTKDGVEFIYEEAPSQQGILPVCEAVAAEFEALGDYKDSKDLALRAREAGNYTAEFYDLLAAGELEKAHQWLQDYDDDFPDRESYDEWLFTYYAYCGNWKFLGGDIALIPYSAGEGSEEPLLNLTTRVTISDNEVTLHLLDADGSNHVEMKAEFGSTDFVYHADDGTYYKIYISYVNHLVYSRHYDTDGTELTNCEYEPA